jgi:biotin carboxyl carrier protein
MIFTYEYDSNLYTVQIERGVDGTLTARVGDETIMLTEQQRADGVRVLTTATGRTLAYTAAHRESRYVQINGRQYALERTTPGSRRRKQSGPAGDLTAQMPGQVVDVLVAVGDSVQAGQTLVVLEAMKMEIRVSAPVDGTVQAVAVQPGEVVSRGQRLVEVTGEAHDS